MGKHWLVGLAVVALLVVSVAADEEECVTDKQQIDRKAARNCFPCSIAGKAACEAKKLQCCGPHQLAANEECVDYEEKAKRQKAKLCEECGFQSFMRCLKQGLKGNCCKRPTVDPKSEFYAKEAKCISFKERTKLEAEHNCDPCASADLVKCVGLEVCCVVQAAIHRAKRQFSLDSAEPPTSPPDFLPKSATASPPPAPAPAPAPPPSTAARAPEWSDVQDPASVEKFRALCLSDAQVKKLYRYRLYGKTIAGEFGLCSAPDYTACKARGLTCALASSVLFGPLGPCRSYSNIAPCDPCDASMAHRCRSYERCCKDETPPTAVEVTPPAGPVKAVTVDTEDDKELTNDLKEMPWTYMTLDQLDKVPPSDFVVFAQHGQQHPASELPVTRAYPKGRTDKVLLITTKTGFEREVPARFFLPTHDAHLPSQPGLPAVIDYTMDWGEVFKALEKSRFIVLDVCNGPNKFPARSQWPELDELVASTSQFVLHMAKSYECLQNHMYQCLFYPVTIRAVLRCFHRAGFVIEETARWVARTTNKPNLLKRSDSV